MPSAKKNEKTKGASASATSQRSSGPATIAAKAPAARSAAGKAQTARAARAASSGAAKTGSAKSVVETAAKAPAPKKSAAKTAKTAAKTTTKATVERVPEGLETPAATPARAAPSKNEAARGAATIEAAERMAPAKPASKPVVSASKHPAPPSKAAGLAATASAGEPAGHAKPAPAIQQPASGPVGAASPKAAKISTAATKARGGSSAFPAAAPAASGKISATTTAGEDKKLAKKNEPSVMTAPVAAEKTANETKVAAKPAPAPAKAKPTGQKHGFKLNEFIVYPAHGVGQIIGMETQEVAGFSLELFVVSFIKDKMILKVPTSKVSNVGMRKLAETNVVDKALSTLSGRARIKRTMWSRRAQEYEAKINSGDLVTIAEVVRDLYRSDTQPEQSYSERQLYEAALDRMAREVAAVRKLIDSEALKLIESFLQKGPRRGQKTESDAADDADEEDVDRAA